MHATAADERARQESYRELVYRTAELVSRDIPLADLLAGAARLGRDFFATPSLQIHVLDARTGSGESTASERIGVAALEVQRSGIAFHATDATEMHVPIRFGNTVRGVISIFRVQRPFDALDASLFEKWALLLAVRIHEFHLCEANARLEVLAGLDGLTGIANRRAFGDSLLTAWERARARESSLAIAMVDVDFFKSFNDTYGHVAGDACLRQIAATIAVSLRECDLLGRYGGEEFAIVFDATSVETGIEISERLRKNIAALGIPHMGSGLGVVTASVGVAASVPAFGEDSSDLLERADRALYEAKKRGRNRVVSGSYVSASKTAVARHDVRTNMPAAVSSFCKREDESDRLRAALERARLVTVTGFGGVGKTRLALETAREIASDFRDGVWFIDLAGIRSGDVIPALVASALDLRDLSDANAEELADRCRHKAFLLLLDNCEHLKDDCARLAATLLGGAPQVSILATSREPLDAPEEMVVALAPFALPQPGTLRAHDALQHPAVRLFVDRARAVTPFDLTDDNVDAVVDLCRRVDGIALGIELAAARLKMLSLRQLSARLDRRLGLLARKGAGVARQQTLRALIDWSFDLLCERDRLLFTRLGIFAASFTLEAATAVCSTDDCDQTILDGLEALVDKSLLLCETRDDGRYAFRYFASIRSYAQDRLAASGELDDVEARLRAYYLAVASAAEAVKSSPDWLAALAPLDCAGDDVRAILEATLGAGRHATFGATFAATLTDYWLVRGLTREGRTWLECAREQEDAHFDAQLRVRIRIALLDLQTMGDAQAGLALAQEAALLFDASVDERLQCSISYHLARTCANLGDTASAREHLHAAHRQAQACADALVLARTSNFQGLVAVLREDNAAAVEAFTRAADIAGRINRGPHTVNPLGNLAEVAHHEGRFHDAVDFAKRALAIAQRTGDRGGTAWVLGNVGSYYLAAGDCESAASFARDGLRMSFEVADDWQARAGAEIYARIACEQGEAENAALLKGYADRRLADLGVPRQPREERAMSDLTRDLLDRLGAERLERLLREGGTLSAQEVLTLVEPRSATLGALCAQTPVA